jgi:hypothetical protein
MVYVSNVTRQRLVRSSVAREFITYTSSIFIVSGALEKREREGEQRNEGK